MEQKVVLNVPYHYEKKSPWFIFRKRAKPSKALKIAAASQGVQSVGWKEGDSSKLVVSGVGLDVVSLTTKLTKKIGPTTIESVEEKKEEKKEEKQEEKIFPYTLYTPAPYQYYVDPPYRPPPCTIS